MLEVNDVFELIDVVATGRGFAFVPLSADSPYGRALNDPAIVVRGMSDLGLERTTTIRWLPERASGDVMVRAIVNELRRGFPASTNPYRGSPLLVTEPVEVDESAASAEDPLGRDMRVW